MKYMCRKLMGWFLLLTSMVVMVIAASFLAHSKLSLHRCLINLTVQAQNTRQLIKPMKNNRSVAMTTAQSRALDEIRRRPTTRSVRLVQIDKNALTGSSLAISLPNLTSLIFSRTKGQILDSDNIRWTGTLTGKTPGEITLVVTNGELNGLISTRDDIFRLVSLGGGTYALVQIDPTKFPPDEPPSFREKEKQVNPPRFLMENSVNADQQTSGPVQIDVLVAYTPAAKMAALGNIESNIGLAVEATNQTFENSKLNIHMNLVDTFQVSYSESSRTFDRIVEDFARMGEVNQHRDQRGADLAALLIEKGDYCGQARAILADASTAFAIVWQACAVEGLSLAHEFGHLMGARHDDDPGTTPFAYGHGYKRVDTVNGMKSRWGTIMAVRDPLHGRIAQWSSPTLPWGGIPMGTAARNDNARVLNGTASAVAAFRARPPN